MHRPAKLDRQSRGCNSRASCTVVTFWRWARVAVSIQRINRDMAEQLAAAEVLGNLPVVRQLACRHAVMLAYCSTQEIS